MPFFSAKVPQDFPDQQRLDKFIASLPNGMNRSKLKSGVNEILVNGKKVKLSQKIKAGDHLAISDNNLLNCYISLGSGSLLRPYI